MITPEVQLKVNNITLAREAAIAGLGITCLPPMIADEALQKGELVAVLEDFPMEHNTLLLSYPKRAYLPRKYIIFIDFIYQALFGYWGNMLLEIPEYVKRPEGFE